MRLLLALIAGVLPVILPLPGGGSGKVEEHFTGIAGFRSSVSFVDADNNADSKDGVPAFSSRLFPRFLKRKALLNSPPSVNATALNPAGDAHEILLTFDDGPDLSTTPLVLEELDRRGLKAVFFVNGRSLMGDKPADRARRHLLRKLATHGHLVGNHSLTHQELCADHASIPHEIDGNAEMIAAITGVYPMLFRAPYGGTCAPLEKALAERGLTNVGWNVDPQEWKVQDADETVAIAIGQLQSLKGRGILLLHDTHPSTARALPRLLDWVQEHNRKVASATTMVPTAKQKPRLPFRIVDYTVLLAPHTLPELPMFDVMASAFGLQADAFATTAAAAP